MFNTRRLGMGGPLNRMSVVPLGSAMLVKNVVKGPVLSDSPSIVMFGELIAPVLLSSTKLPPSVHTGEQVAPPKLAVMVAATSSVMMAAFAAPTLRVRAHEAAASAALIFDFMAVTPSMRLQPRRASVRQLAAIQPNM
jgi:hypothetical protein